MEMEHYEVYFAGPLFNHKDLLGNAALAELIFSESGGRFRCALPQDLEPRGEGSRGIRDADIIRLLSCDAAIFSFDGAELDSGTVVEFMFAKFADIPSLVLRTDFRSGGDCSESSGNGGVPWNLMVSSYPRTVTLLWNAAKAYASALRERRVLEGGECGGAARAASESLRALAKRVVSEMDALMSLPATMPEDLRDPVFKWLEKMPAFGSDSAREDVKFALKRKILKGIL